MQFFKECETGVAGEQGPPLHSLVEISPMVLDLRICRTYKSFSKNNIENLRLKRKVHCLIFSVTSVLLWGGGGRLIINEICGNYARDARRNNWKAPSEWSCSI
jgi:hypothetical protein